MTRLLVLFVVAFVDMVGVTMIIPLLPFYATKYGASAATVGVIVSAFSLAQLLMAPAWGRLSDRRGRRPVIAIGLVVTALGYATFALAGSVAALLVVVPVTLLRRYDRRATDAATAAATEVQA